MSNKQNDHKSNQVNDNKGTSGHNDAYKQAQDNRSNQLNPNNPIYQGSGKGGKK
jgi:hypothetical protein